MINTVLLIDDDDITRMVYEYMLEQYAFARKTINLQNGQEGVTFFEQLSPEAHAPELIFLDLDMPVLSGWDFLDRFSEEFQSRFSQTKVIILSSTVDPEDYERAKKYKVVIDFVVKPLEESILASLQKSVELAPYFQG